MSEAEQLPGLPGYTLLPYGEYGAAQLRDFAGEYVASIESPSGGPGGWIVRLYDIPTRDQALAMVAAALLRREQNPDWPGLIANAYLTGAFEADTVPDSDADSRAAEFARDQLATSWRMHRTLRVREQGETTNG